MKRTLTFWLSLALAGGAFAQTPTVVEKPANGTSSSAPVTTKSATSAKLAAQTSTAKPSPATAKVGVTPAQKTAATAKSAVVAVPPANAKVAASAAKPAGANGKVTPVPVNKLNAAPAAKVVAVPTVKAGAAPAQKPMAAVKPGPQAVPVAGKPAVAIAPAAKVAVAPKAAMVAVKPGVSAMPMKDPFAKNAAKTAVTNAPKAGMAKAQAGPAKAAVVAVKQQEKPAADKKPVVKKVDAAGRRDPFVSPVVNLGAVGSGCSTGKRCLAIDQIALRGVVKSDSGMIAVVVNALDKAYFLRENDPVFDGYVVKITGDSIVFKETFRDKFGKPLTRDVTKTISRPVA
jgi:Tfp pilus assembly protein PilP